MSPKSDELRKKAAEHLKLARLSTSLAERKGHQTIARTYEVLADNEIWLDGEHARRSRPAPPKPDK